MGQAPKILIWDVECTDMELAARTYALKSHVKYHHYDTIKRDWTMLGAAWKWLGDDKVHCIRVSPNQPLNDYAVILALHSVLQEADILIGHNVARFDVKKFNARAIYYGLSPIRPQQVIDTLKEARKIANFSSNTLGYLTKHLGIAEKTSAPDWYKIIDGDADELRSMRQYNKDDVIATEQLYLRLRSWMPTHPNLNLYTDPRDIEGKPVNLCPKCQSAETKRNGWRYTMAGKVQRCSCNSCGNNYTWRGK